MSHLLSRLVDRTFGIAPTIEPVRLPVFKDTPPHYGETAGHHDTGYTYGELAGNPQHEPLSSPIESGVGWITGKWHENEGKSTASPIQSFLYRAKEPDVSAAADGYVTTVPVSGPPGLQPDAEGLPAEMDTPAVTYRQQTSDSLSLHTGQDKTAGGTGRSLTGLPITGNRSAGIKVPASEQEKSRAPGTSLASGSELRPRLDYSTSSLNQQNVLNDPIRDTGLARAIPTIRVTIGRIDVRTVNTPQTPITQRKRKPAQPSLSLDDYLKQRSGGRE